MATYDKTFNVKNGLSVANTVVLDSNRNLTNVEIANVFSLSIENYGPVVNSAGYWVGAGSVQGVQGITGAQGVQGVQGTQGVQGRQGDITVSPNTAPSSPYEGMIWFDSEAIRTYVYYDNFWIEVGTSEVTNVYGRNVYWANSTSLAVNASEQIDVTAFRSYVLMQVTTSAAAWVRIYSDPASRTSDASRSISVDPSPGSGVIAEVVTTGAQTQKITPFIFGGNLEDPPTSNIYFTVTNLSATTQTINTSITITRLET